MQNAWTNPFAAKREEISWRSCGGDLSDDDDSCPDQVVYHEDHLENLFGLYNRSEEAKHGHPLQQEFLKTDVECYKDHLLLAVPSDRETAVWDALEASAFKAPENDGEQVWSCATEEKQAKQAFQDCLGGGPSNRLDDENFAAGDSHSAEADYMEAWDNVDKVKVKAKNGWDCANADIDNIHDHVVGLSVMKAKSYCTAKKGKGTYKKKRNLNFRSMCNVRSACQGTEQRDECQKLSLAQKLQTLAEPVRPHAPKMNLQIVSENLAPCVKDPISKKLLELIQNDSKHSLNRKAKASDTSGKVNSLKQRAKMDNVPAGGATSNLASEREDGGAEASIINSEASSESINDQFRKALLAAPPASTEDLNRQGKLQGLGFGFAARLQKVLERERNGRADFLKMLQTRHNFQEQSSCMEVKIISKSLEARLSACVCNILKFPEAYGAQAKSNIKVMVIFNMQTNAQLELEPGRIVRLYPPWQEVLKESEPAETILCTYFCEVVAG